MKEPLKVGDICELKRTLSESEVRAFAEISGDWNPIHWDKEYAKRTVFEKTIVHGMFLGALISSILGNQFPGQGSIYLSQTCKFLRPVFVGETIRIRLEVQSIRIDKPIFRISTIVYDGNDKVCLDGEAVILYKPSEV